MYKIKLISTLAVALFLISILFFTDALASAKEPLHQSKVFQLSAQLAPDDTIRINWRIAPQYHLYRNRIKFTVLTPATASTGAIILPEGTPQEDPVLGKYQVYDRDVSIGVPILNANGQDVLLKVVYQGCSTAGYCYPPTQKTIKANFAEQTILIEAPKPQKLAFSEQDQASRILATHHWLTIILSFLGFGILLAFTPCVLPMLPILSGIILGQGEALSTRKAFILSLIYVLSMAMTYAAAGMLVGYVGGSVQVAFQQPWLIILFSLLFLVLALSMFGFYDIQLPSRWQDRLTAMTNKQQRGSYIGVAIMGVLATLIVSPCVTPPLVGVLGYISQTGDAVIGGVALFSLGLGMGIPLLLIGTAHGSLLPKAGAWMQAIKSIFGVLLVGMAIWLLERVLHGAVILVLWASLLIVCASYLGAFRLKMARGLRLFSRGVGVIFLILGIILLIGAAMGNQDPLRPLATLSQASGTLGERNLFQPVKDLKEVKLALQQASHRRQITVLDFYAGWCVACHEMEKDTFQNPMISKMLQRFQRLQANVTANDAVDKTLQRQFNVIAPPTILFFSPDGREYKDLRIVGKMGPEAFLAHLQAVLSRASQRAGIKQPLLKK